MEALAPLWTYFALHAYLVVFAVTAIDATGTPFPGRVLLVAAGALAANGEASVAAMILLAASGAVLGDHVWYAAGRWRGDRILAFCCRITLRSTDCVERATALLRRFGPFAIAIARFFTALRIFVTAAAAGSGMPYVHYLLSEIVGALIWASLFILLGYALGGSIDGVTLLLAGLTVSTAITVAALSYRLFRGRRRRAASPAT